MSRIHRIANLFVCLKIKLAFWMIAKGTSYIEKKRIQYRMIDRIVTVDDHLLKLTFGGDRWMENRLLGPVPGENRGDIAGPRPSDLPIRSFCK